MKKLRINSHRASTLQIALATGLISMFAILLALATPTTRKEAPRQDLSGFQTEEGADPDSITALGNYPDTSVPLSGDTTVTPDAAPTNTTSMSVSTSTNFQGTLTGNPTTGIVRVTDAHSAGTYTVTVKAFNNGGPTATRTFTLTVTTPTTCTPVSFAAATNFGAGPFAVSVAVGDFNGDGKQDLAVVNEGLPPPHPRPGSVWILLGNGAGNFSATNFAYGAFNHPVSVAVGDFNGDGKQDLAVTDEGVVLILLGDGAGNFSAPTGFVAGGGAVAVGDFNGDGKQDLAAITGGVAILLGDGAGNFSAPTNFGAGSQPSSVAVGDFNGDGSQDLAVANQASANVSILLGDGAGNFSPPTNFDAGNGPSSVEVGDFNGDGKQDLAVANQGTYPDYNGTVSILLGNGSGSFSAPTNFGAGSQSSSVAVGDFNGDGRQDLVVANSYPDNNVSILSGDGAGNFSAASNFGAGTWPLSVALGDFNGDGKQDLATANAFSGDVSILLRVCGPTPTPSPSPTPTPLPCGTFTFSNTTTINIPDSGASAPYPSSIFIASVGIIQKVTVKLNSLSHTFPANIDVLLVGPDGTNAIIMSDVGGSDPVSGITLTLDDDASNSLPGTMLTTGTFRPTNIGGDDAWPAPAPAPSGGSALSAFLGRVTNGTWSLYVVDDTAANVGSIGGWELTVTTNYGGCVSISGSVSYCSNPVPGAVPNVTMMRTGTYMPSSTLTDASDNYSFLVLPGVGTTYTVTPTKAARVPGSVNINTVDVLGTQRHFLGISLLTGCRLAAADVNGDSSVNTQDIIAIQRFFLGLSTGIANVGTYKFIPVNRTYAQITTNQTGQNYDTLIFGDVASPFAEP